MIVRKNFFEIVTCQLFFKLAMVGSNKLGGLAQVLMGKLIKDLDVNPTTVELLATKEYGCQMHLFLRSSRYQA